MLHFSKKGTGTKQIIFIHGNSQSGLVWEELFENETLKTNYSLIAVDLPGHGQSFKSTKPEEDYSLKSLSNSFLQFLKQFDTQPYILVVNSLGSNVVGEIDTELKNCKGIFITGSCVIGKNVKLEDIFLPNPNAAAGFMGTPTDEQLDLLIDECGYNLSTENKKLIKTEYKKADPNFRIQTGNSIATGKYSDELQNLDNLKTPLAFVFGKEEKLCNIHYLDTVDIPKWKNKVHIIENSGHFSHLDQPEKLAKLIKEFAEDCF